MPTHGKYTGTFGHKNSSSIENVTKEQMGRMKTFKQAKLTNSQWLTKRKPVRSESDSPKSYDSPREAV